MLVSLLGVPEGREYHPRFHFPQLIKWCARSDFPMEIAVAGMTTAPLHDFEIAKDALFQARSLREPCLKIPHHSQPSTNKFAARLFIPSHSSNAAAHPS